MTNKINKKLLKQFITKEGRKEIIELYKDSDQVFFGTNENKENLSASISNDGIALRTNQSNGWIQVVYYDSDGNLEAESFDGKWK